MPVLISENAALMSPFPSATSLLADEARKRRPGLPVLFTTGYTRNAIVHHGVLDPDVQVLIKPYTFEALGTKVQELLSAAKSNLAFQHYRLIQKNYGD